MYHLKRLNDGKITIYDFYEFFTASKLRSFYPTNLVKWNKFERIDISGYTNVIYLFDFLVYEVL